MARPRRDGAVPIPGPFPKDGAPQGQRDAPGADFPGIATLSSGGLRVSRGGRADLEPWERLFSHSRASRETELAERFSLPVVTTWIWQHPRYRGETLSPGARERLRGGSRRCRRTWEEPGQREMMTGRPCQKPHYPRLSRTFKIYTRHLNTQQGSRPLTEA